jgi:hypothetical protein
MTYVSHISSKGSKEGAGEI